ncbi:hypothetical protein Tco_0332377 [Tanacetum coccineum]
MNIIRVVLAEVENIQNWVELQGAKMVERSNGSNRISAYKGYRKEEGVVMTNGKMMWRSLGAVVGEAMWQGGVRSLRVLRIILVVLPEHPSDTKVLTMKMEILLEPTSNKLLVVGFNSLVHSLRALSTLRRSSLRMASAAAKPCQGDSSKFYLITCRIPDDLQHSFRNSDALMHAIMIQKREHAGPMVTTLHGGNNTTRMIERFTMADDLKESSKITQVKGTKFKDHYIMYKEINA